jgi:hypothetical protein
LAKAIITAYSRINKAVVMAFVYQDKEMKPRRGEESEGGGERAITSAFLALPNLRSLRLFVVVSFSGKL